MKLNVQWKIVIIKNLRSYDIEGTSLSRKASNPFWLCFLLQQA